MSRVDDRRRGALLPPAGGRRLGAACIATLAVFAAGAALAQDARPVVSDFSGTVLVKRDREPEREPRKGEALAPADIVRTRKGGLLLMADGLSLFLLRPFGAARIEGSPVLMNGRMQRVEAEEGSDPRSFTLRSAARLFDDVRCVVSPGPAQGKTVKVLVSSQADLAVSGSFSGAADRRMPLRFYPVSREVYRALGGFDVEEKPGRYSLLVRAESGGGCVTEIRRHFTLAPAAFERGRVYLSEDSLALLGPSEEKTQEREILARILSEASDEALWSGAFRLPVEGGAVLSAFGRSRLYHVNGKPAFSRSHRGIDFEGRRGDPVTAPSGGRVVFSGMRITTGNTIVLDHGQGVFSLFFHLDARRVETGDSVEQGERIGEIGATGITEGPHLHWGMFVGGAYVDPMDWVRNAF